MAGLINRQNFDNSFCTVLRRPCGDGINGNVQLCSHAYVSQDQCVLHEQIYKINLWNTHSCSLARMQNAVKGITDWQGHRGHQDRHKRASGKLSESKPIIF